MDAVYALFYTRSARQSRWSQCKGRGRGNRRLERDSVFYLNDVKEGPLLESGRVATLSIHTPVFFHLHRSALYSVPLPVPIPRLCVTFAPSVSLYRTERTEESSVSNSRFHIEKLLCVYYSAFHSRFFCRVMLHRDVPLHLRTKEVDTRSCFSIGSFLHKFPVSLLFSFVPVLLCRLQESKGRKHAVGIRAR